MKALYSRCAGLDVHKAEVVACLRLVGRRKVGRGDGSDVADLLAYGRFIHPSALPRMATQKLEPPKIPVRLEIPKMRQALESGFV